jgi:hypothetical protein
MERVPFSGDKVPLRVDFPGEIKVERGSTPV